MDLSELKDRIVKAFSGSDRDLDAVLSLVEHDKAVFPFNEFEYFICTLIENGGLTYEQYMDIRTEYINKNPYLWLFEISSPTKFGVNFAQTYISGKCSKLRKPSKALDPNYASQYDLWLDGITIEVKASRAVDSDSDEPLYIKALSRDTEKRFLMNFQQLKPQCCDVFIWVAVFRDEIVLWVMNSNEVQRNPLYSTGQHRGNHGNEGQLHIKNDNIHMLNDYELKGDNLEQFIRDAAKRKE